MQEPQHVTPRPDWNRRGGDHDVPYTFGRHPLAYLSPREYARLQLRWPRHEQEAE